MKALLLDLDGVLYVGETAIPGAAEAVAWLQRERIPHLFLTNTTSRPRSALVEKLARMGIHIDPGQILTPPVAAVQWLQANAPGPVALFVPEATRAEFAVLDRLPDDAESGAAAVVIGDLGAGWDFATLNRAFRLLMAEPGPPLVALGMTRYWRAPDGLRLDVGAFAHALAYAAGVEPVVLGKPAEPFFRAAIERLGAAPGEVWMIGDDIRGDVEAAQKAGLHGVLVRTGKFRPSDLQSGIRPDAVLDSIAALPRWWREAVA
ncbi:MAG TPA: TIGR01458 family HAD-type hydrolase [Chromatiales bacterium]|nr:TIGR01458 family HAD-type hydrolase [Chromatiales bacterium]